MSSPTVHLSILVVFHDMAREAPRTLHTLSPTFQTATSPWEVVAVDSASPTPLRLPRELRDQPWLRLIRHDTASTSPAEALNAALERSRSRQVAVMIDGARMVSPGMVEWVQKAIHAHPGAVIGTSAWHLGPKAQNDSMLEGYCEEVEDRLLDSVDWREDGYSLFDVSSMALSSGTCWFDPLDESNLLATSRGNLERIEAFDERFQSRGGGLMNHDLLRSLCELPDVPFVRLLGEGTFHQFHGGVATNVTREEHPWQEFDEEYRAIRGRKWERPTRDPIFLGHMPEQARRFLAP